MMVPGAHVTKLSDSAGRPLRSVKDLQKRLPLIFEALNSDVRFAAAAAVNPLIALEELGFELIEEVARDVEERTVYSRAQLARRRTLLTKLRQYGLEFASADDVLDEPIVRDQIKRKLRLPAKCLPRSLAICRAGVETTVSPRKSKATSLSFQTRIEDPLAALAREHAAMPALIELRALEARAHRLGPRALYDSIRSGAVELPVSSVRARPARSSAELDG